MISEDSIPELNEIVKEYSLLRPKYVNFTEKIKVLLQDLLNHHKISIHIIDSRTKELTSFANKIKRKSEKYSDPLHDITDFSGIRIIAYYIDDINKIVKIIKKEFCVDYFNSFNSQDNFKSNEFGYLSVHYIVSIPKKRERLTEWSEFKGLKAEIQIRTVLQHSWASISHVLQYKKEEDIPIALKRKLYRLAGLFELADEEFMSLRNKHKELENKIKSEDVSKHLSYDIDVLTLKNYLNNSKNIIELYEIAISVGFKFNDGLDPNDEDNFFYIDVNSISELIQFCSIADIHTIDKFNGFIIEFIKYSKSYLTNQIMSTNHKWVVSVIFIIELLMILYKRSNFTVNILHQFGWDLDIANRVIKVANEFRLK